MPFDLPVLAEAADARDALAAAIRSTAEGELTPTEAAIITALIERLVDVDKGTDVSRRLRERREKGLGPFNY